MAKYDPRKTALIILDLQNDVIHPKGAFASSGSPAHAKSQNVVGNVKALAAAFRAKGAPVIHIHHLPETRTSMLNAPLFSGTAEANACVPGSWGAAAVDGLKPQKGDIVVEKQRMSGFYNTTLDTKLRGLGASRIVITGAWTNFSVEHSSRDGADLGYEITVVTDGTSTVNDEWQNAALNYALTNIADRISTAEVLKAIGAPVPAPKASAKTAPAKKAAAAKASAKKARAKKASAK